ncbi:cadherin-like domain-containing protein [Pelagibius sp.]|uniref:cadherin-like domain-containing protein n=1 Tax=Pelagibius sp. TaxID=1931238 RepID=UPI00261E34B9|nr:cadherin-like domain-containing protein [Pelagibius sp.]
MSITVNGVNDAPVLVNNSLTVGEGQTVTLDGDDLSAADDDDDTSLIFTVSNVTGGRFALAETPETPITSFSQQQVLDGAIVFVDDGDEVSPGYSVSVSDGQASTVPAAAEIDYTPVNDDPVVTSDTAGLVKGASLAITTAILSASDAETTDPAQLTFTVTAEVAGEVLLSGAPAASFTLADVIAGLVAFQHDGSDGAAAGFTVTASDPDGGVSAPADLSFAVATSFVWTNGSGNGDWNNPLNWASGSVPIDGADVVIPDQPGAAIFSSGSAVLQSLTLESESLVITGGSFAVTGELTSEIGSTIAVSGGSFEVAGGTLNGTFAWTGGTVTGDGATLTINGPANLGGVAPLTLDIDLDLNGLGAMTGNIQGGGAIANGGSLLVPSAATLGVGFSNEAEGSLAVLSNLTIDNGSGFRNSGSITIAAFATLAVVGGDFENAFGAEIGGEGIIDVTGGSLINNGTINPGTSPGTFTVLGDYEQGPDGLLTVEIDGTGGDLLQVSGTASFAGIINVVLLDGFVPTAGDTLNFVQAAEIIDNGVEVTGLEYAGGLLGIQLAGGVASFVAIAGSGDTFVDPFEIIVGDEAFGSLTVDAGQDLVSEYFSVGEETTGIGEFVLTNGSTLTILGPSVIGNAGTGDATISGGASAEFISGNADNLIIGNFFGSTGSLLIDGAETNVTTSGESNRVRVGLGGTGDMTVQGGASLNTLLLDSGVAGTGTVIIRGDGTQVTVSNDTGLFPGDFADRAAFVRAGRDAGGDGTVEVREGARLDIRAGIGVNENTNEPGLQIARDPGSVGSVLIDGPGSIIALTQTAPADPDNDIFGPFVQAGDGGDGDLEIRNGGQLTLTGEQASLQAARQFGAQGSVLVDGPNSTIAMDGAGLFVSIGDEGDGQMTLRNDATFLLSGGEDFISFNVGYEEGASGEVVIQSGATLSLQGGDNTARLRIGREEGSDGRVLVQGPDSLLTVGGTTNPVGGFANRIEVGREGTGHLETRDGAMVISERLDIGFGQSGVGTALVDDAEWQIGTRLWIGREGQGTLTIQNGGTVTANAGPVSIADGGGSTGVVNVDATSSLNVNGFFSVGNGFFEPNLFPDFGQDAEATGTLNINGGSFAAVDTNIGDQKLGVGLVTIDSGTWQNAGELNVGLQGDGTLEILNGGSVTVEGDFNNIANGGGSTGSVNIDAESSLTVNGKLTVGLGWFDPTDDPTFGQSTTATGSLAVNGGSLATQGVDIGGQRLGIGEATIDGGIWTDTSGPNDGFAVGQAGDGTLVLRNGASVTTNGGFNSIGNFGGSRGSVTVDATSSLAYEGFLSVGNGVYDPVGLPGFGRDAEATGILTIDGGMVTAQNADIGGTERGRGFVTIDGDGALFDAGESLNIGHQGEGTVTLEDGGELQADVISVGAGGSLGGVGLVDGDVFINGGTIGPGLSPGELEVDGSFTLNDGLLRFEIAGTTPGTGHDVLTVSSPNPGSGNVSLNDGVIQFGFDPDFTPLVSDSFAFLNYVSLAVSDHVAYRFTGVDPTNFIYGFIDDAGTRSLRFFGNSVSLGNGIVFEGGEGDDYEAGSAFADRIEGAEGSDTLGGAGGNDTLTGGDYGDTFVFTLAPLDAGAPGAELTITDFFPGEDVIEVIGWDSTSPDGIGVTGTDYGTLLDFGGGYSIHLDFVFDYVLSPDDFVFRVLASEGVSRSDSDEIFVGAPFVNGSLEIRDGAEVDAPRVLVGQQFGASGQVLVTGPGSTLTTSGENALIELGNVGVGEMTVSGGGQVEGLWLDLARDGVGSVVASDAGTRIFLSNDFGSYPPPDADDGAFLRVGRNAGSIGILEVRDGAVIDIEASPGFNGPGLQIAREDGSQGSVLVDGAGSQINLFQTDPADSDNGIFGPSLHLRSGDAQLTIENGGSVSLFGQDANVIVGRGNADGFEGPGDPPDLAQSRLEILAGGSLTVDGDDGHASMNIGRESNGDGAVVVRGEGSELLLQGFAPNINVARDGTGELTIDQGGNVATTFMSIGRVSGSQGSVTVDGSQDEELRTTLRLFGRDDEHQGAFLQVGWGGQGSLTVKGGALLSIDGNGGQFPGFNVGRDAGSTGTMVVDGIGTQVLIANGDGGPAGSLGFIAVGREGNGTLDVTQGAQVVNAAGGFTFVGREAVASGALTVDGVDGTATLFDAGDVLVVGADFDFDNGEVLFDSGGTGSVTVTDGGTVRAGVAEGDGITDVFIGSGGTVTVQAGGTLIGDIENVGGTLINGNSPGTAAFGGDFVMSDGVLEVELGGTEAGAFDLYQIAGTADFTGGVIEFSMIEGYDPLAGDSFIFLTAGALTLDEDALSFVVRGVDQAFDFALDLGADSLGLTVLNDAGSGESLVFLGGEGDEAFAGGAGNDRLDGGGGRDTLTGGDGSDIFVLRAADGADSLDLADVIGDFEIGSDSLGLAEGLGAEDLTITATQGGDAAVALQSSGAILAVLQGVSAADIDPAEITTVV